ncbi:hypothetical protein Poly51_55730 [Rubripirellula tenax]|uniref:Uncharacterized protein n=1 Tax=Rubripirellula tenax TaxID=2528015 RepID=A0A5C6EBB5_9BACT|nr:hypothetical protein Poly51_55730 [Rubripirellula tenax]
MGRASGKQRRNVAAVGCESRKQRRDAASLDFAHVGDNCRGVIVSKTSQSSKFTRVDASSASGAPVNENRGSAPIIEHLSSARIIGHAFSAPSAEHQDRATPRAESDNGSVQRVAGVPVQANEVADHRHSVATVGYPQSCRDIG